MRNKSINLLIKLKWKIAYRFLKQMPIIYTALLFALAILICCALLKIDTPVTWKSLSVVAAIQLIFCTQIKYRENKKLFLKQFPHLYISSLFIDFFLASIPFLFVNIVFWCASIVVLVLYLLFSETISAEIKVKRQIIPSPFIKSAYLWHSQQRVLLPAIWLSVIILSVIAYIHNNFNLAIVMFCSGCFIALTTSISQTEGADFVTMYLSRRHFMKRTFAETLINSAIFMVIPAALLFVLFPEKWIITGSAVFILFLLSINLVWVKYIFYPSSQITAVAYLFGIFIQGALAVSIYGIALIPVFYGILYLSYKQKIKNHFYYNERVNH